MYKYIVFLLLCMLALAKTSAQVIVTLQMDTNQIYIGEQVSLKLKVTADANLPIVVPQYPDSQLIDGVEVVDRYAESNDLLNAGRRQSLTQVYRITSFDSALYYIPPVEVRVGDKTYKSREGMALKVVSPEVDTTKVDKFFGAMENAHVVYDWNDLKRPLCFWLIGILLIVVAIYMAIQIKNNHRILPKINLHLEGPPHKVAIKQIEKLKSTHPTDSEEAHIYYSGLSEIVRTYIAKRYGFKATAMTTAQIIERLKDINTPGMLKELDQMFQTSDLVKYAGISTIVSENDPNIRVAVEYINTTKESEAERKNKRKTKADIEVTRSYQTHALLVAVCSLVALSGIVLVGWAVGIMYNLYY